MSALKARIRAFQDKDMGSAGFGTAPVLSLNHAIQRVLSRLYMGIPLPQSPVTDQQVPLTERNRLMDTRYAAGETRQAIAQDLGLSQQHVHQIIRDQL
jgi:hypothetical protein